MNLKEKIENKQAKVAVIGMGYVGLPHAYTMSKAGFDVLGLDIQQKRVDMLNEGVSYIGDISDSQLKGMENFSASIDYSLLKERDVIIICVPTPIDKHKIPNTEYIESSVKEISKNLNGDQLIILESTTYPGTTEDIVLPILKESDKDFYLAFAPERIDPGNKMPFEDVPKVVGGINKESGVLAQEFYLKFLKNVHLVSDTKTAEMTKILENTYRLVNISMINEFRLLCGKMGIDVWEVIEAAKTKPYGFTPFYPSPKCGGHCISTDPFYLSYKAREYNFWARFIELAGEINEQMPHYVVTNLITALNRRGKTLKDSKILVLGVAYKKDIADSRESAAHDIIPNLKRKGAIVKYHDPYIEKFEYMNYYSKECEIMKSVDLNVKDYDVVLILTDHSNIDYDKIAEESKLVIDTRNAIKGRGYNNVSWF